MSAEANIALPTTVTPGYTYRRIVDGNKTVLGVIVAADSDEDGNITISAIETGGPYSRIPVPMTFTNDTSTVLFPASRADFDLALAESMVEVEQSLASATSRVATLTALKGRVAALEAAGMATLPALAAE